ncbi:MAG TPA: VOC family protein [Candidatus Bathyarchaeia archaeon]|nr:VOC family protein [Candidatus Bathyarchaeia archaeon]
MATHAGLTRTSHLNVNCTDLERSLHFYRDLLGLRPLVHTTTDPQPGRALGLDGDVQWDAWLLGDDRGFDGVAIDLLEWKTPLPGGRPAKHQNAPGFSRFALLVSDLDRLHRALTDAGVECASPPAESRFGKTASESSRIVLCKDPDGTTIELVASGSDRVGHVHVNCRNLVRSRAFYEEVLGLTAVYHSTPPPQPGAPFGLDGDILTEGWSFADPRGAGSFVIDLVEWKEPRTSGTAYPRANHLGIYRLAFLVQDLDGFYERLQTREVRCASAPQALRVGAELPVLQVLLCFDPDGAALEFIEDPVPS